MRKRIGFLKNAIARPKGYYSPKGEKLVSVRLTQEEIDAFNSQGTETQVVVEQVAPVEEAPKVVTRTRRSRKKPEEVVAVDQTNDDTPPAVEEVTVTEEEEAPPAPEFPAVEEEEEIDSHGY